MQFKTWQCKEKKEEDLVNESVVAGLHLNACGDTTLTVTTPSPMSTLKCFQLYMPH